VIHRRRRKRRSLCGVASQLGRYAASGSPHVGFFERWRRGQVFVALVVGELVGGRYPIFLVHGPILNFFYAGTARAESWNSVPHSLAQIDVGAADIRISALSMPSFTLRPRQHMAHHRHTQDWKRDGELAREPYTRSMVMLAMRVDRLVTPVSGGVSCDLVGVVTSRNFRNYRVLLR